MVRYCPCESHGAMLQSGCETRSCKKKRKMAALVSSNMNVNVNSLIVDIVCLLVGLYLIYIRVWA